MRRTNAVVRIEERTMHGWDLARATSQDLHIDDARLDQVDQFFELFAEQITAGEGPFGPAVSPPERATRLESIVARTGREPSWQQPADGSHQRICRQHPIAFR